MRFNPEEFNLSSFSNQELLELKRNQEKIPELNVRLEEEISQRNISAKEMERIKARLDFKYGENEQLINAPLPTRQKLLILFLPMLTERLFLSFLKKGNLRKSKEYWSYYTLGCMLYALVFIVFIFLLRGRN